MTDELREGPETSVRPPSPLTPGAPSQDPINQVDTLRLRPNLSFLLALDRRGAIELRSLPTGARSAMPTRPRVPRSSGSSSRRHAERQGPGAGCRRSRRGRRRRVGATGRTTVRSTRCSGRTKGQGSQRRALHARSSVGRPTGRRQWADSKPGSDRPQVKRAERLLVLSMPGGHNATEARNRD
jgi:hypothetical protein